MSSHSPFVDTMGARLRVACWPAGGRSVPPLPGALPSEFGMATRRAWPGSRGTGTARSSVDVTIAGFSLTQRRGCLFPSPPWCQAGLALPALPSPPLHAPAAQTFANFRCGHELRKPHPHHCAQRFARSDTLRVYSDISQVLVAFAVLGKAQKRLNRRQSRSAFSTPVMSHIATRAPKMLPSTMTGTIMVRVQ